jgi:hypothetical protein
MRNILNLEVSGYDDRTALYRQWIEREIGWVPALIWTIWRREKFLSPSGIRIPPPSARGLVTRPTPQRRSRHLYTFGSMERLNQKKSCTGIVCLMLNNLTKNMNVLWGQWPYATSTSWVSAMPHSWCCATPLNSAQYNTIQYYACNLTLCEAPYYKTGIY